MAVVRIAGVALPAQKRIEAALPDLYGIGLPRAQQILRAVKIDPHKRTKDLSESEVNELKEFIDGHFKVEGTLRQEVTQNIKRLKEIGCYRGARHIRGLPVRGQRTRTNSRTVRGNVRRTAGSGRRRAAEKT